MTKSNIEAQCKCVRKAHTELRDEEEEHDNRGDEGNNTASKCTAVEILIDFGVGVQIP